MPGKHKKGTNDADGNGKKGGSLPEDVVEPTADATAEAATEAEPEAETSTKKPKARDLEKEVDELKDLMRRNGWSI